MVTGNKDGGGGNTVVVCQQNAGDSEPGVGSDFPCSRDDRGL